MTELVDFIINIGKAKEIVTDETNYDDPKDVLKSMEKLYQLCGTDAEAYHSLMDDLLANVVLINLPEFRDVVVKYNTESDSKFHYS